MTAAEIRDSFTAEEAGRYANPAAALVEVIGELAAQVAELNAFLVSAEKKFTCNGAIDVNTLSQG